MIETDIGSMRAQPLQQVRGFLACLHYRHNKAIAVTAARVVGVSYGRRGTGSVQIDLSILSNSTHLVNGVLAGGEQVLVGTAAHVKEEFVSIANLNQEAGSNLQGSPLSEVRKDEALTEYELAVRLSRSLRQ